MWCWLKQFWPTVLIWTLVIITIWFQPWLGNV